jgi:hypothetical protein
MGPNNVFDRTETLFNWLFGRQPNTVHRVPSRTVLLRGARRRW